MSQNIRLISGKIKHALVLFIATLCATAYWKYNIGFVIFIYQIFAGLFIAISLAELAQKKPKNINYKLYIFILFLMLIFFIKILSLIGLDYSQESFNQFLKRFFLDFSYLIFFILLIQYIHSTTDGKRRQILEYFIIGGVLSSLYGILYSFFIVKYGVDIDQYLWKFLTFSSSYISDKEQIISYNLSGMYRGKGFAGVNSSAIYYVAIFPILIAILLNSRGLNRAKYQLYFVILTIGEILIMSRIGLTASILSILILFALQRNFKHFILIMVTLVFVSFFIYHILDENTIASIVESRVNFSTSRYDLYKGAVMIFIDNPIFGIGLNNFSVFADGSGNYLLHDENLHSSWLSILVETGILGVMSYFFFFIYILKESFKSKSIYSLSLISSLISLLVAASFNQLFDLFYFNFFLVLMFSLIVTNSIDKPIR